MYCEARSISFYDVCSYLLRLRVCKVVPQSTSITHKRIRIILAVHRKFDFSQMGRLTNCCLCNDCQHKLYKFCGQFCRRMVKFIMFKAAKEALISALLWLLYFDISNSIKMPKTSNLILYRGYNIKRKAPFRKPFNYIISNLSF